MKGVIEGIVAASETGAGACLAANPPATASSKAAWKAALAAATSSSSSRYALGICSACTSLFTGASLA